MLYKVTSVNNTKKISKFKQKQCLLYKDARLCWYTKNILLIHFLKHITNCQKEAVNIIIVHENIVYENSGLWNVRSMKCWVYEMSGLWNVRSMKCLVYELSGLWNVRSMKCPVYEVSGLWNVRLWNVRLWIVPTPKIQYFPCILPSTISESAVLLFLKKLSYYLTKKYWSYLL